MTMTKAALIALLAAPMLIGAGPVPLASPPAAPPVAAPAPSGGVSNGIVAIVNGSVISREDIENRERLFVLSTGLHPSDEVLNRLSPQVTRALVDERLELQEMQRRKIVVSDADIAAAIKQIESRNGMPEGALRARLAAQGVTLRTLIDQIRVQIGWARVLRDQLGENAHITDTDISDRIARLKAETGQTEYRVGEIFIPVDQPSHEADAQRFADTVIGQLRAGAPFPIVAAQFSTAQTALEGGDLGWVRPNNLDPALAKIVTEMPDGAISNPIRVIGGFAIVTLRGKRQIGNDMATIVSLRQVFLPFTTPLDPQNPTAQQREALEKAKQIAASVKSCDEMEAANKAAGATRPADPGEIRAETVGTPALRSLLLSQPVGKTTGPLVANDGIAVAIICSREQKNVGEATKTDVFNQLTSERVELASRQLLADLRRRAIIEQRSS
jgi:peptidyl-prolyl cis-trans isomerase SurA